MRTPFPVVTRKLGRTSRNIFFISIADVFGRLVLLFVFVGFARTYGQEVFGQFSFAFNLATIINILPDMGINTFIVREVAKKRGGVENGLGTLVLIKTGLSLLYLIVIPALCYLFQTDFYTFLMVSGFAFFVAADSMNQFMRNLFRAHEKMEHEMVSRVLERGLLLGTSALLFYLRAEPWLVCLAFAVYGIILLPINWQIVSRRYKGLSFGRLKKGILPLLRPIIPFALVSVVFTVYFKADVLMLERMKGFADVGTYSAAYRLYEGLFFIPNAIYGSLYPVFSRLHAAENSGITGVLKQGLFLSMIAGMVIGGLVIAIREPIISILYGPQFIESSQVLAILSAALPFTFGTFLLVHYQAARDRTGVNAILGIVFLCLNVLLNFISIPRWSYKGAAAATLFTEVLLFVSILLLASFGAAKPPAVIPPNPAKQTFKDIS